MGRLNPTPPDKLTDSQGRPHFLWDVDMSLAELEARLRDPDPVVRGYFAGKVMRQAKPDDALQFVSVDTMRALWPHIEPYLGETREFWFWLLASWKALDERRQADASAADRRVREPEES